LNQTRFRCLRQSHGAAAALSTSDLGAAAIHTARQRNNLTPIPLEFYGLMNYSS
jgi:hypothetical protein